MDYQIPPVSRVSSHSGEPFAKGDRVVSSLVLPADGQEVSRVDVREDEIDEAELPGEPICRWTQAFKPRDDSERLELEAMKLTADNLFLSLFEGESEPTNENAELKRFLGLMLERKRLLKPKGVIDGFIRYAHRSTKQEFMVPDVDLPPAFFLENQEKLDFIVAGGDADVEAEKEAPKAGD